MSERRKRCRAAIYVRDCYRVSRRGDGRHFSMHYTQKQCSRAVVGDGEFCRQHQRVAEGCTLLTLDWHPYIENANV